ncbi:hypothetical protein VNO80_29161 [Phaseolus coccineus]|uniref:Uncharacterized protein n=1 Tax=Phaseolus coccineus TaxID=3886 RepID=A0AAN9LAE8_PHACN
MKIWKEDIGYLSLQIWIDTGEIERNNLFVRGPPLLLRPIITVQWRICQINGSKPESQAIQEKKEGGEDAYR